MNIEESLKNVMLGCKLGEGLSREVYVNKLNPDTVIKIAKEGDYIYVAQNCTEFRIWEHVVDTSSAKFFAPCEMISDDGRILIQKRTKLVSEKEYLKFAKKKIPAFVSDVQIQNVGWYEDRIVIHDYGMFSLDHTLMNLHDYTDH